MSYKCVITLLCLNILFLVKVNCDELKPGKLTYYLYTKDNPQTGQIITNGDIESLNNSYFSINKKTKIIIHGFQDNFMAKVNILIRNAFLDKYDVNVILLDWGEVAHLPYEICRRIVPKIGESVAQFIDWLATSNYSIESMHVIGFSLGAHLAGYACRNTKSGKIEYLTGLDPAKPHWENSPNCINKNDAKYVEIIHTSTNISVKPPIGHNDFYPNSGILMGGCEEEWCSHSKAFEYFAESIESGGFTGIQCQSIEEVYDKNCSGSVQLNMGGLKSKKPYGIFYLETNDQKPFSKN